MHGEARVGDYRVVCDRSGRKVWASETIKEWNGLRVFRDYADKQRQPQDFVTGVKDDQRVPDPRPEAPDAYVAVNAVTPASL